MSSSTAPDSRAVAQAGGHPPAGARIAGLAWAHLLNDGATNYLPGVLPAVLVSLHQPVRVAGALIAALTIGQAVQPITGLLADRLGGRGLTVLGLLMTSIGGGLLGVAHAMWMLVVLLLLIGIGGAFFHPQALAGIRSLVNGRHGLITSVFLVGGEIGRGLWPTLASLVVTHFGLVTLWVMAVPGVLSVPLLLHLAPRLPKTRTKLAHLGLRDKKRPLAVLVTYRSIQSFATYTLVTFIPIMWHLRGGSLVSGATIITTMLLVGVVGNLGGGHLADRFGRMPILLSSAVATGLLTIPVAYLHTSWLWVVAGLAGVSIFLTSSTTVLIGQDIFPRAKSMGSGIALGLGNGIGALLVFLIGLLVSEAQIVRLFWLTAILSVASAALVFAFPRALLHRPPRPAP